MQSNALWSGTNKNRDVSTGPLARPFARSLTPLTRSRAPDCLLRSRPPLRSLIPSLAHFAHSLARGKVNYQIAILSVFFSIFDHSALLSLAPRSRLARNELADADQPRHAYAHLLHQRSLVPTRSQEDVDAALQFLARVGVGCISLHRFHLSVHV